MKNLIKKIFIFCTLFISHTAFGMENTHSLNGLPNQGNNNCFINASLQCLNNLENFTDNVSSIEDNNIFSNLNNVLKNLNQNAIIFSDNPLYQSIRQTLFDKSENSPEDALEFIEKLINSNPLFTLLMKNFFEIKTHSTKVCLSCNKKTIKEESDFILKCSVTNNSDLKSYINQFLAPEIIKAKCDQCSQNNETACTKQLSFQSLPDQLIVAAKIYNNDLQKQENNTTFPLKLALHQEQNEACYHLTGFILHGGESLNAGHYISIINKNNKWYLCNDETIELLSLEEVNNIASYGFMINSKRDSFEEFTPYIWFYEKNNIQENLFNNDITFNSPIQNQNNSIEEDNFDWDSLLDNLQPVETLQNAHTLISLSNNPLINNQNIIQSCSNSSPCNEVSNKKKAKANDKSFDKICKVTDCSHKKSFATDKELYEHLVQNHCSKNENEKFHCAWPECNISSSKKNRLTRHIIIHTNYQPYTCTHQGCSFKTNREYNLKNHLSNIHKVQKTKKYIKLNDKTCHVTDCTHKEPFATDKDLYNHLVQNHCSKNENEEFYCAWPKCDHTSGQKSHFIIHLITHTNYQPYTCTHQKCSFKTNTKDSLKNHLSKIHKVQKTKKYIKLNDRTCHVTDCSHKETFATDKDLYNHLVQNHCSKNENKKFHCAWPKCDHTSDQKSHFIIHLITHTNYQPYTCTHQGCSFKTNTEYSLKNHLSKIHKVQKTKKYIKLNDKTCHVTDCTHKEPFATDKDLYEHLIQNHCSKNENEEFYCAWPECDHISDQKSRFINHLITHTNYQPYECTHQGCSFKTNRKNYLKTHFKNKHDQSKKK